MYPGVNVVPYPPTEQPNSGHLPYPPQHQPQYPPGHGQEMLPPVIRQPAGFQVPLNTGPAQYIAGDCPPGLQYLTQVNQLLVKQKVELLEVITGFETENEYKVKNSMGQDIYYAKEQTDCCTRNCCGPSRPFDMTLRDNAGIEVIHLYRPLKCQSCCFPCCLQVIEISSPPGNIIGSVEQEWSICNPRFAVKDQFGNVTLRIEGPFCTYSICGNDVEFKVISQDGSAEIGKISKQWSGLVKEAFTDADNFGISFPMDLDAKMKATLLGACFLIDFMFFEKAQNKEQDNVGMM